MGCVGIRECWECGMGSTKGWRDEDGEHRRCQVAVAALYNIKQLTNASHPLGHINCFGSSGRAAPAGAGITFQLVLINLHRLWGDFHVRAC